MSLVNTYTQHPRSRKTKSFDPDFGLRAQFQVQYGDVINPSRASKLFPYLSSYDSFCVENNQAIPWPNLHKPLPRVEEESPDSFSSWSSQSSLTNSSHSPATLAQYGSDVGSVDSPTANQSCLGKRQRAATGGLQDPMLKKCKLVPRITAACSELHAGSDEGLAASQWKKSIVVRLRPWHDGHVEDTRYTYIKLPAPDVSSCAAAVCAKMGIPYTRGMPMSWVDSKTSLHGPFNQTFLHKIPDMQDFVLTIVQLGVNGDIGLLFET